MTQLTPSRLEALSRLIQTVHRLRAPGGCPWDRAQTHQSLRPYLIEEAYEVLDVLDQIEKTEDLQKEKIKLPFREELGDLLMQVLLHSEMASETGAFDIYDVAQGLDEKLIRRHPHVFGEQKAQSADAALQNWEKQKAKEKASKLDASVLDGLPRSLPVLQRTWRVLEKVTKVGFQWDDMQGPLQKMEEELGEFKTEVQAFEKASGDQKQEIQKRMESELGDLLFTVCNVAFLMKINPEDSLRNTVFRFEKRFKHVESRVKEEGKTLDQSNLQEMDVFWEEAKKLEKVEIWGLTGGIASGKTTVGQCFTEMGIPVIDADLIVKDLTSSHGAAYKLIETRFGTADRVELRKIVFSDPQAKEDLEKILHPLIQRESRKRFIELSAKYPVIIYEASLLVETGNYKKFSGLITVEASPEIRTQRLLARSGWSTEQAKNVMESQVTDEQRRACADHVISNTGSLDDLRQQVKEFVQSRKWKV